MVRGVNEIDRCVLGIIHSVLHTDSRKPELLNLRSRSWWQSYIVGCEGFSSMKRGVVKRI